MDAPQPIYDISDTIDTEIDIVGKIVPIHVARFTKTEMEAFEQKYDAFMRTRGSAALTDEQRAAREREQLAFMEDAIVTAITLDKGLIRDRRLSTVDDEQWVRDGAGLLAIFHSRKEVLSALLVQIVVQNRLAGIIRKNSNSPRASDTGSEVSIPTRGGDGQGSTADDAGSSSIAALEPATENPADSLSGASGDTTRTP